MKLNAILLPTDFSKSSAAALDYASTLAAETGATLHLVHVADDSPAYLAGYGGYEYPADFPTKLKQEIESRLEEVEPSRAGVDMQRHYLTGTAVSEIVDFADREQIDLIVMGTHGRTGLSRILMGSIAEGVLRQADCPVLTIKQPIEVEPEKVEACKSEEAKAETLDDCGSSNQGHRKSLSSRTKFILH